MSSPQNHTLRAGLYMVITTACFVAGDTCIKLIGATLPLGQVIGLIGVVSTFFLLVVCWQQGILKNLPMIYTRMVLLRSLFDAMGSFMFVSALMHMPLANLSSVMQSVPLVVVVVGVIFLGEKAGFSRIAAVIAGFVGVLLIVKPSPQTITIYEFLAVGAVIVVAFRDLVTKRIPAHVPLLVICLLYTSDAADDLPCVDLGGRRIIQKKHQHRTSLYPRLFTQPWHYISQRQLIKTDI